MEKKLMSAKELDKAVEELKSLEGMEREIAKEIEKLMAMMKGDMIARGVDEFDTGMNRIRYKAVVTSRIDTKLVKDMFPEVAEVCSVDSTSYRFSVA